MNAILSDQWPADGVESLGSCPVCRSSSRQLLYGGLRDQLFHCAPGEWNFHLCRDCGSGYLDPRPTPETIGLAYRTYYTHEEPVRLPAGQLRGVRWLQRLMANGYKNWKYRTDLQPSSRLGILGAFLLPRQRAVLDRQFRHINPRTSPGRLLDIGFGDGGFLENARSIGWSVVGVDADPAAVKNALSRGLDARLGTVHDIEGPFDMITMCHVIEHLHDPVDVLHGCYRLLSPGGTLWLETPNARAIGLRRLGRGWMGLDAPRHLVLFNRKSLELALRDAGFTDVCDLRQASPVMGLYAMSPRILEGRNPDAEGPVPLLLRFESLFVAIFEMIVKSRREFIAVTARKAA